MQAILTEEEQLKVMVQLMGGTLYISQAATKTPFSIEFRERMTMRDDWGPSLNCDFTDYCFFFLDIKSALAALPECKPA